MTQGDQCKIINPVSKLEEDLLNVALWFGFIEKTHGYAKVVDCVGAVYWVHPKSLVKL